MTCGRPRRAVYAVGSNEAAAYMSGVKVDRAMLAALAGILIAGYSSKAFQAIGHPYLLPSIAAVVIGTNILGGSGRSFGTIAGTVLIVLLQSVLTLMQMPEARRQIIYGVVIIAMLLAYGPRRAAAAVKPMLNGGCGNQAV